MTALNATTLVIEDDRDNRELLVRLLQRCGLLVESAATVAEALEKLAIIPKVVLLDMELPDGTGREVLQKIRSTNMPVKVAVVTGSGMPEALDELHELAPDAVFVKPFVAADLCDWVEKVHG